MTTRLVGSTVQGVDGTPLSSVPIEIELMLADAFVVTGSYSMASKLRLQTGLDGSWSTPLHCNDDLSPVGTLYSVAEKIPVQYGGTRTYLIQVLTGLPASPAVNQTANLIVPAAVPVGGTYSPVSSGPPGIQGPAGVGLVVANNAALNAISPKVTGQPVFVEATGCWWMWNGVHYELVNQPDFLNSTERNNAIVGVATYPGQSTYQRLGNSQEGPYYQNSNNVIRLPWNLPWGRVASITVAAATVGITTTPTNINGLNVSWSSVAGRRYKYSLIVHVTSSVANDVCFVYLQTNTGTNLFTLQTVLPLAGILEYLVLPNFEHSPGAVAGFGLRVQCLRVIGSGTLSAGGLADQREARLMVEDVGPSGAPS